MPVPVLGQSPFGLVGGILARSPPLLRMLTFVESCTAASDGSKEGQVDLVKPQSRKERLYVS